MNEWRLVLGACSPAMLGGVGHAPAGVHAATARLTERRLFLPGTSLRGVLRDAFRRFAAARTGMPCAGDPTCVCACCQLFGTSERAGVLAVRSGMAEGREVVVAGVAIDRELRTAHRTGRALWSDLRGLADFETVVSVWGDIDPEDVQLIEDFWEWLREVGLSLGRRKSAGVGRFRVGVLPILAEERQTAVRPSQADEVPSRFRLVIRLLEPARIVGPRQRDFYREGLAQIPVSTLRGALGWALVRDGMEAAAHDIFTEKPVLLTPAFPRAAASSPVPWLSARRCRSNPEHSWDAALRRTARAMGAVGIAVDGCPVCGADGEPQGDGEGDVEWLVIGRTAIDPMSRGAARGQLHYEVALAPGQEFRAEMLARPSQAEAIEKLRTIVVGGRRARGMGHAELRLEPLESLAPIRSRLETTAAALRKLGVHSPGYVALLGVITDGAIAGGLRQTLEGAELEIVTGEIRTVERGGWDEQTREPRSLRRLLRAGSWVAVRTKFAGAVTTLEELETKGVIDPEGWAPLFVRVRDDFSSPA